MLVPPGDAGGRCRVPGQRGKPAPPDRRCAGFRHPDWPPAQWPPPSAVRHRNHRDGGQRDHDPGTLPARNAYGCRRPGAGPLEEPGHRATVAQAGRMARRHAGKPGFVGADPIAGWPQRVLGAQVMNALIPALAAAALLLLALGIVLWQRAAHGARRQASAQYMARQLQKYGAPGPAVTERAGGLEAWHGNPTGWNNFLL